MADLDRGLAQLAEWLDIRTDRDAIEEIERPERSPFARPGPSNARYGNRPSFMESPSIRPWSRNTRIASTIPCPRASAPDARRVAPLRGVVGISLTGVPGRAQETGPCVQVGPAPPPSLSFRASRTRLGRDNDAFVMQRRAQAARHVRRHGRDRRCCARPGAPAFVAACGKVPLADLGAYCRETGPVGGRKHPGRRALRSAGTSHGALNRRDRSRRIDEPASTDLQRTLCAQPNASPLCRHSWPAPASQRRL